MAVRPATGAGDTETMSTVPEARSPGIPERFQILRRLGTGGFGAVFSVLDKQTGKQQALKRLSRVDPASIYRFKQEFRVLQGQSHPNLVRIHELFSEEDYWCFTMDQVDGVRFDSWVRGDVSDSPRGHATDSTAESGTGEDAPSFSAPPPENSGVDARGWTRKAPFIEKRLRDALRQLVQGVLELHALGVLHRDLKPSNVLLTEEGKLVILDFGLALNVEMSGVELGTAGTPAYMSPEQARGASLTTASDWYSVGVMLYEGLTGHLPFIGSSADMIQARQTRLPRIGSKVGLTPSLAASPRHVSGGAFVGRENELIALHMAFEETRRGKTVVAHVYGRSGFGKTTVVQRFVSELGLQDDVVVLEGRCYERESVPFKALDDLVDALGRYLSRLRPVEAAGLMPRDARSLIRLFPALGRLGIMSELPGRAPSGDVHELRRRAFSALREMLARISDTKTLVLVLDDVHWGDRDSADLIRNLLAPPDVPPALLIAGYRNESIEGNDLLRTLRTPHAVDAAWQAVDIPIGPLSLQDAKELALSLLGDFRDAEKKAALIAEESAQSPLFISELVRAAKRATSKGPEISMQGIVESRTQSLSESALVVLRTLAVCERPLTEEGVARVAELKRKDAASVLDLLRDEHLAMVSTSRGRTEFEIFHDKIRKATLANSPASTLSRLHRRLAAWFEENHGEAETIAHHYLEAGDRQAALRWVEVSGDRAVSSAAFDHAAKNYQRALELADPAGRSRLARKLAPALARAGKGVESAKLHLKIAAEGEEDAPLHLRQAGSEYLRSGHTDAALRTLAPVLAEHGLSLPKSPQSALLSLLFRRARLRIRGLDFKEGSKQISAKRLEAIDLCWVLGNGLAGIDLVRSAHYNALCLWLALESGEPARIARTLALDATLRSLEGGEAAAASIPILDRAEGIARRLGDTHALGWVAAARAVGSFANTDLQQCAELCREATRLMREDSELTFREIGSLTVWFWLHASFLLGHLKDVAERAPAVAREAEARGDRYTMSTVQTYVLPLHWAAQGRPDEARRQADAALDVWPEGVWFHQHWAHLRAHCFIDLYEGRGARILERTREARPQMKQSFQLRIRTPRLELTYLEGRGLLELGLDRRLSGAEEKLLAERIQALHGEKNRLATMYAWTLEAGRAAQKDPRTTAAEFQKLAEGFASLKMVMHESAALMRRADATPGEEGKQLFLAEMARLRKCGVADPLAMSHLLVPRVTKAEGKTEETA
jgi:serine/threonine protein kinase